MRTRLRGGVKLYTILCGNKKTSQLSMRGVGERGPDRGSTNQLLSIDVTDTTVNALTVIEWSLNRLGSLNDLAVEPQQLQVLLEYVRSRFLYTPGSPCGQLLK